MTRAANAALIADLAATRPHDPPDDIESTLARVSRDPFDLHRYLNAGTPVGLRPDAGGVEARIRGAIAASLSGPFGTGQSYVEPLLPDAGPPEPAVFEPSSEDRALALDQRAVRRLSPRTVAVIGPILAVAAGLLFGLLI